MTDAARFWDDIAEKYAAKPVDNLPAYERKLVETKERLRPEHVVLDIGCGTGSLALELAPHVTHVHGVDISSEMVRIARGKAAAQGAENVTFYAEPFDEVSTFERESFDMVCAYNILHLVPDHKVTLARIFDLIKPGGSFVSSTACLGQSWMPFGLILPVMRLFGKAPPAVIFDISELHSSIRETGFVDLVSPDVGAEKMIAFSLARKPA